MEHRLKCLFRCRHTSYLVSCLCSHKIGRQRCLISMRPLSTLGRCEIFHWPLGSKKSAQCGSSSQYEIDIGQHEWFLGRLFILLPVQLFLLSDHTINPKNFVNFMCLRSCVLSKVSVDACGRRTTCNIKRNETWTSSIRMPSKHTFSYGPDN